MKISLLNKDKILGKRRISEKYIAFFGLTKMCFFYDNVIYRDDSHWWSNDELRIEA